MKLATQAQPDDQEYPAANEPSGLKKSFAPAPECNAPERKPGPSFDLEFPVAPEFVSRTPRLDPQVMLKRCAETMPWRSSRPEERARRLAEAIPVKFVL